MFWNGGVLSHGGSTLLHTSDTGRLEPFLHHLYLIAAMMKTRRFAFCALSVCSPLLLAGSAGAQGFGGQQAISTSARLARSVYATDLDGDGDADVLSASQQDDKIAWHENIGGGVFGPEQVITTAADYAFSVYATDLDGDGDADVLSASRDDDKIAWYENLGGGAFGAQQVITTATNGALSVYAMDLDGDGDADVLSASITDSKIAFYENLGSGSFGAQQVITTASFLATSVYATDLDGDGDPDVLSASAGDDKIAFYENLGGGAFGAQQVISSGLSSPSAFSAYATDLDGDGDADVLSASGTDDKIAWYENLGGGTFGTQQVITTAAAGAFSVYATDLDGDGDPDVLSASTDDNKVAWYRNQIDGTSLFCNPANTHSGGAFATLGVSNFSGSGLFHLAAQDGPVNQFGYFLVSAGSIDPGITISSGELCLTGPIGRYNPAAGGSLNSIGVFDGAGIFQNLVGTSTTGFGFDVPFNLPAPPGGTISTGDTWHFQLWYRDGAASNFSDGVSVTF